jgi:predicted nucleotidyltransferase
MTYDEALKSCIFQYISGSHAYGTSRPDSDIDRRGVFIAPLSKAFEIFQTSCVGHGDIDVQLKGALKSCDDGDLVGARERIRQAMDVGQGDLTMSVGTVQKPGEDDELHELRKFLKLATDCNPNIIEFLYVKNNIITETDVWKRIRSCRHMFLSKKSRYSSRFYIKTSKSCF